MIERSATADDWTAIRRKDRAVRDDAWIRSFLARVPVGVVATVHGGQPFLNSNIFVYDVHRHALYFHTARQGRTRANVEGDSRVCFTATEIGRLLPAGEAIEFSVEYAGVVAFGRGEVVEDVAEALRALGLLMAKYAPHLRSGRDYRPPESRDLSRTSVFRIAVTAWSAKVGKAAEDFPGAYPFTPPAAPVGPGGSG